MSLVSELIACRKNANELIKDGDLNAAVRAANEILRIVSLPEFPKFFRERGKGQYCAYSILGMSAVADGDIETAREMLLLAGKTPPSPSRRSFGPNMILPGMLLDLGETDVVFEFLDDCKQTWDLGADRLEQWTAKISAGEQPDFGPNLVYSM